MPVRREEQGQASVELALLLPVIVVLLLAVLQVGLLARDVVLVTHAAREAARAAAVDPDPGSAQAAARAAAGLEPDRLTVRLTSTEGTGRVSVEVRYRARSSVPLVGVLIGERTLRASATMRIEHDP